MKDSYLRVITAVVAVGIFGMLVATAIDGSVRSILNPRVLPRTLIGAGFFAVVALVWAVDGVRRPQPGGLSPAALWPLLLPVVLLPAAARSTSGDYSQIRLFTAGGSGRVSAPRFHTPTADNSPAGNGREELATGWVDEANPELLTAIADTDRAEREPVPPSGPITIDTDTFSHRVNLIWDDPDRFAGDEVRLTGFVYRRPDWPVDTFVVARLSIWCCAADAAVVGLPAKADRAATAPTDGQWVELSGTLGVRDEFRTGSVAMEHMPELTALEWSPIEAPRSEYVFPE